MLSLNKLWQRCNGISRVTRYLTLLFCLVALMFQIAPMINVRAQDQNQARGGKISRSQNQNAARDARPGENISSTETQVGEFAASQDDGAKGVVPSAAWPAGGGNADFSNGKYNCAYTWYTYNVVNGPPNTWGELHATRCSDGRTDVAPNWIKTDAYGNASKPVPPGWQVLKDETTTNIYILWTDGTRTSGGDTKVDDFSVPLVNINPGYPTSFSGTATDARCGSGFGSWTSVKVTFQDRDTSLYWNGSSYSSTSPIPHTASWNGGGTSLTWSIPPPPLSAHVPGHRYKWCTQANDRCMPPGETCLTFLY